MARERETTGIKTSTDDKTDLEYIKKMVECVFEEMARDGVRVGEVCNHVREKAEKESREKR